MGKNSTGRRGRPPSDEVFEVQDFGEDGEPLVAMTPREWRFLNMYLDHGDMVKAALDSGIYKPRGTEKQKMKNKEFTGYRPNAINAAQRILKRHKVLIERVMDERGMSLVQLMTKLVQGLDAEQTMAVKAVDDGGGPLRDEKGRWKQELVTVADHKSRVKYLEMALKLRGAFPSTPAVMRIQGEGPGGSVPVSLRSQHLQALEGKSVEELQRMFDELVQAQRKGPVRLAGG